MSTKAFQKRKQDDEDDEEVVLGNDEEPAERGGGVTEQNQQERRRHHHHLHLPTVTIFSSIDNIGQALRDKQNEIIRQQQQEDEDDATKSGSIVLFPPTLVEIVDTEALSGYGGTVVFDPTIMSHRTIQQLNDCEILITEPHVLGKLLKYMNHQEGKGGGDGDGSKVTLTLAKLRWCQSTYAGADTLFSKDDGDNNENTIKPPNFIVTRFAGAFGPPIAEWCIGRIIEYERSFYQSHLDQARREWINNSSKVLKYRYLSDLTLCIVGCLGDIGTNIARVAKTAFHMNIIGIVRTDLQEQEFDHYQQQRTSGISSSTTCNHHDNHSKRRKITNEHDDDNKYKYYDVCTTSLKYGMQHCDYIISVLPPTKETRNLFTKEVFSFGNKHRGGKCPVFINVGRGDVIAPSTSSAPSTSASAESSSSLPPSSPSSSYTICNALDNDDLSHVILDVFELEPLPSDDILWVHPEVTISPHVSGLTRSSDVPNLIIDNYQRYVTGQDLNYQVNWNKTY